MHVVGFRVYGGVLAQHIPSSHRVGSLLFFSLGLVTHF